MNSHYVTILTYLKSMIALHYGLTTITETAILGAKFDLKSRDGMPRLLMGLQEIYKNEALRDKLLKLLEEQMLPGVSYSGTSNPDIGL